MLPFLRLGKYWNSKDVETILSKADHEVKQKVLDKEEINGELNDFKGLWTLTIAHHALIAGQRAKTIGWMWLTVILGATFLGFQAYEYIHAYTELNLKLSSGIYGSTFFMLTGFHGFHVFVGMTMLLIITLRLMKGHFTPNRHFGFEGAAWYWHFVDVVWLGLYLVVYWL